MNFTGMLKEGSLQDKVILITGGGTGLGKSIGKYFMELGADLIITSRKQDVLDETAKEFSDYSGDIFPISGDVRNAKEVKQIIETSLDKFGRIDGLVNNAAPATASSQPESWSPCSAGERSSSNNMNIGPSPSISA